MNINGKEIDVKQFRNDWALALMTRGIVVKLSIGRWRGTAQLKSEELGITFSDQETINFMKRYVRLGTEKLLPPQIIREIEVLENKARNNLRDHSFLTVWGNFVPFMAFDDWQNANAQIREDFMTAANRMGQRYEEIISIVKNDYRKMAKDVWQRLYPLSSKDGATESFIENFVSKIICKIPSKNDIVTSFKYDVTYFDIPMPSFLENDLSKSRNIQREREEKDFQVVLERQTKEKIAQEYISKKTELIDRFLQSTVDEMRDQVAKLCDSILQSIGQQSKGKEISKHQINRVKKMVKKVHILNFYDDKKINDLLSELEFEVLKVKGDRNKDIIIEKLRQITEVGSEQFVPDDFSPTIGYLEV